MKASAKRSDVESRKPPNLLLVLLFRATAPSITSKNPLDSMSNPPASKFPLAKAYAAKRLRTNPIIVRMLGCKLILLATGLINFCIWGRALFNMF